MLKRSVTATLLAISVALVPASRVVADAGDFVAGAIIGGIVGHAATKQNQRNRAATRTYTPKPPAPRAPRIPSTQEGREIQASLNYFGFNAGTVDGQLGRRSRDAVSSYQAYMGYPSTGQLSPFEQNLLISSYNRAQAGGFAVTQQVAGNPDGTRGLLKVYRAELAGQTTQLSQGTPVVLAPQPVAPTTTTTTTTVVAPAAPAPTPAPAPAPEAADTLAFASGLPSFLGSGATPSLASHCNTVSLLTNTNGGFTTAAAMTDPNVALNEQFCLARTYAIANSETMIARVQGFTPDQIAAQCKQFGPAMQPHVAALALKTQPEVVQDVAAFILTTGMSPVQLKGTAQICMGVGYRTDDMEVALGSALMLFAMGDHVYGEVMGHHLAQGFGTSKRVDAARAWYAQGIAAADNGAPAVFAPGQPERTELLRQASLSLGSSNAPGASTQPLVQPASLPSFGVATE